MPPNPAFAELVAVACHDMRTPLATVYGFARTLQRLGLDEPAARYVEMIGAAASQIGELVDQLGIVARIEAGRYEPVLFDVDSLELAREAAAELGGGRVEVSGEGATVRLDPEPARRAVAQLARATGRHGGHETVALVVRGTELELSPVSRSAAPVLLGEHLLELGAPAAATILRALGGSLAVEGERLLIGLRG